MAFDFKKEYKEFYRTVFKDYKEPLFWIHLNMDYPFNLKGILYFPKINTEYESIEGNTYYTQVQYYPTTDIIRIALLYNSTYMVYFNYQNTNSTTCPVIFFESENTYYGEGLLYPSLINNDIAVAFTDTNIPYSVQTSAAKLTTSCVKLSLCYFDIIMSQYSVGVTYKDLGFNF